MKRGSRLTDAATRMLLRPAAWICFGQLFAAGLVAQQVVCTQPPVPILTFSSGTYCYGTQSPFTVQAASSAINVNGSADMTFVSGTGGSIDVKSTFHATAGTAPTTFHAWADTLPTVSAAMPAAGGGTAQQFTWFITSPSGADYVTDAYMLFNTTINTAASCYIRYNQDSSLLYLLNDASTWVPIPINSPGSATANSQCTISAAGSSAVQAGNLLMVTVAVSFNTANFSGSKNNYLMAYDYSGLTSGWLQVGSWNIVGGRPTISSLSPSSGPVGTTVTVKGTNFGASQGSSTVAFNGVPASIVAGTWNTTTSPPQFQVTVPAGATTGSVVLTVGGVPSSGISNFTVSPRINSLTPAAGPRGTTISVSGANFGTSGTVTLNGASVAASNWSTTGFNITVPQNAALGNATIVVTVAGLTGSSNFNVTSTPVPTISSLSPTAGPPAGQVTISGANFGTVPGTVTFGGVAANVAPGNWNALSILTTVPAGALTGGVVVTAAGVASAPSAFTVAPTITSIDQNPVTVGQPLIITGLNFGLTQGTSTVAFNGTLAQPASIWGPTSIKVTVPAGTSPLVVTVGGMSSNQWNFTANPVNPMREYMRLGGRVIAIENVP